MQNITYTYSCDMCGDSKPIPKGEIVNAAGLDAGGNVLRFHLCKKCGDKRHAWTNKDHCRDRSEALREVVQEYQD